MRLEWDEAKNRQNLAKHGIDFETAALVFEDPHALSFQDRIIEGEERWQTFGVINGLMLIVMVAHTWWEEQGEDIIRLISARSATAYEKEIYEAHKKSG
jgi:uncharacterized DUF497 family protein